MDFLDVNDVASVSRIIEDNAILHNQTVKKLAASNPHNMIKTKTQNTQDGDKNLTLDLSEMKNSNNESTNVEKHLLGSVQGSGLSADVGQTKAELYRPMDKALPSRIGLKSTPQHLLQSLYTLRYMFSKENKTKVLYTLNFFRSIQKRISLDLREFGTRERVDSHLTQPYTHSSDAEKSITQQIDKEKNAYHRADDNEKDGGPTSPTSHGDDIDYLD